MQLTGRPENTPRYLGRSPTYRFQINSRAELMTSHLLRGVNGIGCGDGRLVGAGRGCCGGGGPGNCNATSGSKKGYNMLLEAAGITHGSEKVPNPVLSNLLCNPGGTSASPEARKVHGKAGGAWTRSGPLPRGQVVVCARASHGCVTREQARVQISPPSSRATFRGNHGRLAELVGILEARPGRPHVNLPMIPARPGYHRYSSSKPRYGEA